jgi:hypothetical protein
VPASLPDPAVLDLDLDGVFAGDDAEIELPTVQRAVKVPLPMGGDDAEAVASSEIGRDWLSRATESERSLTEADLEIDLDDIPASFDEFAEPGALADADDLDEPDALAGPEDRADSKKLAELDEESDELNASRLRPRRS